MDFLGVRRKDYSFEKDRRAKERFLGERINEGQEVNHKGVLRIWLKEVSFLKWGRGKFGRETLGAIDFIHDQLESVRRKGLKGPNFGSISEFVFFPLKRIFLN
ncbi:MAG: hypothetical protein NZ530_04260 [Thermodesulfobacteriaceae bacterium]|nr:hypothetical protein [Thermodesulfobacteriaceae bacterium]MDW8136215.1 hypothetical protein [Thermodesulfobacterium sp.]